MNGGFSARNLAIGLIGAALIFPGCGGSSNTSESDPPVRRTYSQALYSVEVPRRWVLKTNDEPTRGHLESIWRDPADPHTSILIEGVVPDLGSPMSRARSVRARASRASGYREIAFEPISLAGKPAARWVFAVPGHRRVDYFFSQCEVAVTVLGSSSPADFESLTKTFRQTASSVAVRCP